MSPVHKQIQIMRNLFLTIIISFFFLSCSKDLYYNKTSAELAKSTLQVQDKTTRGDGFIFKSENNEVVFLQGTTDDKSTFDKVVIVAFEQGVNCPIKSGTTEYTDVTYFRDKRSIVIHSKKDNMIYLFGLDEKESLDKIALLKENPTLKSNAFKTVLGYGISVLSGKWNKESFLNTPSASAFDRLISASIIANSRLSTFSFDGSGGAGDCTSGGTGSSSCSIGSWPDVSCSVTCNSGYYACCKSSTTTCTCIKIPAP